MSLNDGGKKFLAGILVGDMAARARAEQEARRQANIDFQRQAEERNRRLIEESEQCRNDANLGQRSTQPNPPAPAASPANLQSSTYGPPPKVNTKSTSLVDCQQCGKPNPPHGDVCLFCGSRSRVASQNIDTARPPTPPLSHRTGTARSVNNRIKEGVQEYLGLSFLWMLYTSILSAFVSIGYGTIIAPCLLGCAALLMVFVIAAVLLAPFVLLLTPVLIALAPVVCYGFPTLAALYVAVFCTQKARRKIDAAIDVYFSGALATRASQDRTFVIFICAAAFLLVQGAWAVLAWLIWNGV
jgi:hypothetical protein